MGSSRQPHVPVERICQEDRLTVIQLVDTGLETPWHYYAYTTLPCTNALPQESPHATRHLSCMTEDLSVSDIDRLSLVVLRQQ